MTYPIAMVIYSFFVVKNNVLWAKITGIISIVLALSTHWYTGVVMELNPGPVPEPYRPGAPVVSDRRIHFRYRAAGADSRDSQCIVSVEKANRLDN